jgi:hypothetical protein
MQEKVEIALRNWFIVNEAWNPRKSDASWVFERTKVCEIMKSENISAQKCETSWRWFIWIHESWEWMWELRITQQKWMKHEILEQFFRVRN